MGEGHHQLDRGGELPGCETQQPVELVGPGHLAGAQVPLPAAEVGDLLGVRELVLAREQPVDEQLALGVRRDPVHPADPPAGRVVQGRRAEQAPHGGAVRAVEVGLEVLPALARAEHHAEPLPEDGAALRVEEVDEALPRHLLLAPAEHLRHPPVGVDGHALVVEDPDAVGQHLERPQVQVGHPGRAAVPLRAHGDIPTPRGWESHPCARQCDRSFRATRVDAVGRRRRGPVRPGRSPRTARSGSSSPGRC